MNKQQSEELKSIIRCIDITDLESFRFKEELHPVMNRQAHQKHYLPFNQFGQNKAAGSDDATGIQNLMTTLSGILYGQCYCYPFFKKGEKMPEPKATVTESSKEFINYLSQYNFTKEGWDRGWVVYNTDGKNHTFVQKNGELKYLIPGDYRFSDPKQQGLKVNTPVDIKIKKEDKDNQYGFYFVYSEAMPEQSSGVIRFYWNVSPEGAVKLVELVSTAFNRSKVPFRFKCLKFPSMYANRSDCSVLYLEKRHFKIACLLIKGFLSQLEPYLQEETPLFAKRLHKGLSFAEDPNDGSSFGMHRSDLMARALVEAHRKNINSLDKKLQEVVRVFKENGIDPAQPWLNPNSHYQYNFTDFSAAQPNH